MMKNIVIDVKGAKPKGKSAVLENSNNDVGGEPYLSSVVVTALEDVQYKSGFKDGQEYMLNKIEGGVYCAVHQKFEEMKRAAETFFQRLITIVPKSGIIEHRLGWDSTTGSTATLTVISREHEPKMSDIQELASACEMEMFDRFKYDCCFWVITDEKLDEFLIEQDFPYVRMSVADVNV